MNFNYIFLKKKQNLREGIPKKSKLININSYIKQIKVRNIFSCLCVAFTLSIIFLLYYNNFLSYHLKNNIFFFLSAEKKLKECKNYAIFIYNYPFDDKNLEYGNIGDYIQSLAALQFLPKNCKPIFIDRDEIDNYNGEKAIIIMNGWYRIKNKKRFISPNLLPIFISIHISNPENIDSYFINNIKKFEPIGCRDTFTLNALKKHGINSYFSSCLTTTMDINYLVNDEQRNDEIIFIDYNFGYDDKIDNYIKSLKEYNFSRVTYVTHKFKLKLTQTERFNCAKNLINKYARAKLIITTRIHGALPCLALNTPFIFVNKQFDRRFYGIYQLFNTVGINSTGNFNINVLLNENNLIINPKAFLKYANKLKNIFKLI